MRIKRYVKLISHNFCSAREGKPVSAQLLLSLGRTFYAAATMRTAFRICVISPKGYLHSQCFMEVALLLKSSFDSLGLNCDAMYNEFAPDRINIVLGGHLLKCNETLRGFRYIPYQLEQLNTEGSVYSESLRLFLANATEVWDYSPENIQFLSSQNITARHLPLGHHPRLEQIPPAPNQDVDVLFFGSVGERRRPILDRLSQHADLKFKLLFGAYGVERDAWISRSKIILNVHYYPAKIFEAVRVSYLINNRCFVLSEESTINPYRDLDLCFAAYDELEDQCRYFLSHPEEREQRKLTTYQQFKREYPMIDFVRSLTDPYR